jgi:hypothetical protein
MCFENYKKTIGKLNFPKDSFLNNKQFITNAIYYDESLNFTIILILCI